MYLRALRGKEKAWGADHTSTLDTVNNLGNLYADRGKMEQAEELYMRALRGKEKALGAEHTSTLEIVNNLSFFYANQGKLGQAEEMYERALRGYEKALGAEHTSTLDTVNNLGAFHRRMAFGRRLGPSMGLQVNDRGIQNGSGKSLRNILSDCAWICQQYSSSSSVQVYGDLGHILLWLNMEDSAIIAFEQQIELVGNEWQHSYTACDGCGDRLTLQTGRLICRSYMDIDLCRACYGKYEFEELIVVGCQDHSFLASPREGSESMSRGTMSMGGEILADWLEHLRI